tara:strand:- start:7315 stop:7737 length:423 start_codon:yes stop_codon:yes gene_type:complete
MSSSLPNLMRLNRWKLDEKRRLLGEMEKLAEQIQQDILALDQAVEQEKAVATNSTQLATGFTAFYEAALQRRENLKTSMAQVMGKIDQAREEVAQSFRELKKYELAHANMEKKKKQKLSRKEQSFLDDLGLELHRRKNCS